MQSILHLNKDFPSSSSFRDPNVMQSTSKNFSKMPKNLNSDFVCNAPALARKMY